MEKFLLNITQNNIDLFGNTNNEISFNKTENKIDFSVWFLKKHNNKNLSYHLAFSGGKDSVVLWWLCEQAKVNYKMYFYNNPLLNNEAKKFTLEYFPETKILKPPLNFYQIVEKKGILPTRKTRYCCQFFKECYGSVNHFTLTGVRNDESYNRRDTTYMQFLKNPITKKMKAMINPLLFFKEIEVWDTIKNYKLPIADSYKTLKRNGCVGCPLSSKRTIEIFIKYPRFKKVWLKASEIVLRKWKEKYKKPDFENAEDLLLWYCSNVSIKKYHLLKRELSFESIINEIENYKI